MILTTILMWWAMVSLLHAAWHSIGQVLPGLTNPHRVDPFNRVIAAIHNDNVSEYQAARAACGTQCDPDMGRNDEERQYIEAGLKSHAWPILAFQIQSAPQVAQRLLHTAGSDYEGYEGSPDLVNFLLAHGARADSLALANAVAHCRAEMTQTLLQNGADPRGEYPAPNQFVFDGPEDLVTPPRRLLDIAAEQQCDPVISKLLLRFGATREASSQ